MRGGDSKVDYLLLIISVVDSCPTVKFNIQLVSVLDNDGSRSQKMINN